MHVDHCAVLQILEGVVERVGLDAGQDPDVVNKNSDVKTQTCFEDFIVKLFGMSLGKIFGDGNNLDTRILLGDFFGSLLEELLVSGD